MSSQTTNLHFVKPAGDENISRPDYNGNWDKTDDAYAELNGGISNLASGIAIMANGNTHQAIPAGYYVYVRNHDSLTERMYTANSAIAENATLSANNLTPVTNGGLNSIYAKLSEPYNIGSVGSISSLQTSFTTLMGNMVDYEERLIRFLFTTVAGYLVNTYYVGTITRFSSSRCLVRLYRGNAAKPDIIANNNNGTWEWYSVDDHITDNEYFKSGETVIIRDAFIPGVFTGASNFRSMIYLPKKMSNITPSITCEYFEMYYNGSDKVETANVTQIAISPVWIGTAQQSNDKNAFVINISGNFSGYSANMMGCGVFRGTLSF